MRGDRVEIVCNRCDRKGSYSTASLIAKFGIDEVMPEVLRQITIEGACPQVGNYADGCRAKFSKATVLACMTKPEDIAYVEKHLQD